jgi:hypothetical protein
MRQKSAIGVAVFTNQTLLRQEQCLGLLVHPPTCRRVHLSPNVRRTSMKDAVRRRSHLGNSAKSGCIGCTAAKNGGNPRDSV